ncbi:hypothetical protein BY996DRAFT_6456776 [Phakopsora pachyrhizi]|nr:hypothetical protein BY996DRAFT_6456776 [Phakopsora pachyrhizi]
MTKASENEIVKSTLKFDLNELPEEMDINLGEEIIEQENEKDLHQVSKKQRMEIVHVPAKHQGLIGHSRSILNTFESFNRVTNINIVDSVGHRVLSKDQPSSSKSPPIRIVNLPRFKTVNYQSSYNRDLHDFIKENLVQLMPQELENYQFTSEFLHGIQNCYWNNELSIFVIAEEKIPYGLETPNLHEASDWFAFTSVFLKLYKFENLNGVFFTEKMRRTAKRIKHSLIYSPAAFEPAGRGPEIFY